VNQAIRHSTPQGPRVPLAFAVRLSLITLLFASVVAASCATRDPEVPLLRVTIATTILPASAPVYVAEEKGFFADEGLDVSVENYAAGTHALQAIREGKADFATMAETPAAAAAIEGQPVSIIATIAEVEQASMIVARRDSGIESGGDLRGKRIGVVPTSAADFFLHVYLLVAGLSRDEVEVVELAPDEVLPALLDGSVDAISSGPPSAAQGEDQLGANAVALRHPGLYTMQWNVVKSPGTPSPQSDAEVRLISALLTAEEYIRANPTECMEIASRRTGTPIHELVSQWRDYRWDARLDQRLLLSLEEAVGWLSDGREQFNVLELVETRALRQVAPENVTIVEPAE
jgi:ABC-type nitrate/sulfonate/bicarbonate transport system substrate-binding protein